LNARLDIWRELGIAETLDPREIRRAYARRLKVTHPEDDAEGFRRLRAAYEYALAYAAHQAQQGVAAAPAEAEAPAGPDAPRPTPAPESVSAETPAPPVQAPAADEEMRALAALYDALGARLAKNAADGWPDVEADRRALHALLNSPSLQRIDLQLRLEYGLADMLVNQIPHSDHLIATAVRHFEWDRRQHESSLPDAARGLLARLHDLAFIEHLGQANNEQSRAYEKLKTGKGGFSRWWNAGFMGDHSEPAMLEYLRQHHPQLLGQLPRDTVAWWERFAQWPRPSRFLGVLSFIVTIVVGLAYGFGGMGEEQHADRTVAAVVYTAAGMFGFMALKYFAVDLPAMRLYLHWDRAPPTKFALGWLGLAAVVLLGSMAARDQPWAPYTAVVLGAITWYWTLVVSGPVPEIHFRGNAFELRPVRVAMLNLMMFWWLVFTLRAALHLDPWFFVAFMLVLAASGTSRHLLVHVYLARLQPRGQLTVAVTGLLLAIGLALVAWFFGRYSDVKPWLIAAVVLLVLARRAIPHGIMVNHHWMPALLIVFFGWLLCHLLSTSLQLDSSDSEYEDPAPVVTGALFFTLGAVYSFGRAAYDAVREMRLKAA
jgi:hypothetical protein